MYKNYLSFIIGIILTVWTNFVIAGTITSNGSGNWTDASTWVGGVVPAYTDNVVIESGHIVYVDAVNANNNTVVKLCTDLTVKDEAYLYIGHNDSAIRKQLQVYGNFLGDGAIIKGKDANEEDYAYNANVFFALTNETTTIAGNGVFHPLSIKFFSTGGEKTVDIDHYYVLTDADFFSKSDDKVFININKDAYVHARGNFGFQGSSYQWSSVTASSECTVLGVVVAQNLNIFSKNTDIEKFSRLIVKDTGFFTAYSINEGNNAIVSDIAGFRFVVKGGGTFRLGRNAFHPNTEVATWDTNLLVTVMNGGTIRKHYSQTETDNSTIISTVDQYRPSKGYMPDDSFKDVYGATFTGGAYHFTEEPFMLEGKEAYKALGARTIKTTLNGNTGKMQKSYSFNSNWSGSDDLVEIAKEPYLDSLYSDPYYTEHVMWTYPKKRRIKNVTFYKYGPDYYDSYYDDYENQFYLLAKHFLETYKTSGKRFVVQNWEGDWMLRGQGVNWEGDSTLIPEDVDSKIAGMIRMFRAQQRAIERARAEVTDTNAEILNGVEINKLWTKDTDGNRVTMEDVNVPSLAGDVLPHLRLDITSWSAYDAAWYEDVENFPVGMWKGIDVLEYYTNETGVIDQSPVQIGEFGVNENGNYINNALDSDIAKVEEMWDKAYACAIAKDVNNFFTWSFFNSGPQAFTFEAGVDYPLDTLMAYSDGKWVLRPDGKFGANGNYMINQLKPDTYRSVASGLWSNPSTWENGQVPTSNDNVVISGTDTVTVDLINTNSNTELALCKNIHVETGAVLNLGHDASFTKILRVSGNIIANGTIQKGDAFSKNARVYHNSLYHNNYIAGNGSLDLLTLKMASSTTGDKNLYVDVPSIYTEEHLIAKSDNRLIVDFSANTNADIDGYFGMTGSTYQWMSATAMADFIVKGNIVTKNLNMLTKNETAGEGSSLTIADGANITASRVNQQDLTVVNASSTFTFNIEAGGSLTLVDGAHSPVDIDNADINFIYNDYNAGARFAHGTSIIKEARAKINIYKEQSGTLNMDIVKALDNSRHSASLINLAGQVVGQKHHLNDGENRWNVNHLDSGIYIVQVVTEEGRTIIQKVVL